MRNGTWLLLVMVPACPFIGCGTDRAADEPPVHSESAHVLRDVPAGVIIDGHARFEVLSPTLVRLEYAESGAFEDRPTFQAIHRNLPAPRYTTYVDGGVRVISTDKLTLRYTKGSGAFTAANLSVDLAAGSRSVRATPHWQPSDACFFGSLCETEAWNLAGRAQLAGDHAGFTGSGFVAGLTAQGAQLSGSANAIPAAGDYAVRFRYANSKGGDGQTTTRTITLRAGAVSQRLSLPITANWDTWALAGATVHLEARNTPVSLSCEAGDSCNVNIDSLAITAPGAAYPAAPSEPASISGYRRSLDGWSGPAPMAPGLLTSDGWFLLDDTKSPISNVDGSIEQRPAAGTYQDGYFFGYGHDYRQGLRDFHDLTGPAVLLPEWAYGIWFSRYYAYSDSDYRNSVIPAFRSHQVPLDMLVVDTDFKSPNAWNGWNWNTSRFPDPRGFMDWARHQQNLKVSLNIHASISTDDPKYAATSTTAGGDLLDANCHNGPCKHFDFGRPKHLKAYFDLHQSFEDQGLDVWWLDQSGGEGGMSTPNLSSDAWINSRYALRASARGQRGFAFSRIGGFASDYSGFRTAVSGAFAEHRYSMHFTGDTSPTWDMLSFEAYLTAREGVGIGLPAISHDIGGHYQNSPYSSGGRLNEDLYVRWVQMGTFLPILRLHSDHGYRLPWDYGAAAESAATAFLRLRESLVPYTYSLARQAYDTGVPIVRPLYLDYPENAEAYDYDREYLYGDGLLVAPVRTAGTSGVATSVWLPPGGWIDYFTGEAFQGARTITVTTDLSRMPLFVRAGGIVAQRSDYVDHATSGPLARVTLDVGTGGGGAFALYEDAGDGLDYSDGAKYSTTPVSYRENGTAHTLAIGARGGNGFPGQVGRRTWTARFRGAGEPVRVTVNGQPVGQAAAGAGWNYDRGTRTLTVTTDALQADRATLIAYDGRTGPIVGLAGKCVDVANAASADKTAVQLYTCNGTWAQSWDVVSDGTLRALGKCMDVADGATTAGTVVQLYTCNDTGAQKWTAQSDGTLRNPQSGLCLEVSGNNPADRTRLVISPCSGADNQKWVLPKAP